MKTATSCLLLVLLASPLGACVVAVGAAGGVAAAKYVRNQEVRAYRSTVRTAYEAALGELPQLGYPAASVATLGPTEANIKAGDAKVAIAQFPEGIVRIAVSVGTFETDDHRRRARLVHERLAMRLGPATGP